jgi:S1-C subfamily serine protease
MRQISDFLADRIAESARHVIFVQEFGASGVVIDAATVVTTPQSGAPLTIAGDRSTGAPPAGLAPEGQVSRGGGWALVIGRSRNGETISASGILGGLADATCAGTEIRKLLLNVPLDATYSGAGVFDVSGDLLGVVARCDGAWVAVSHPSVMRLLEGQSGSVAVVWRDFGVRTREPGEQEIKLLRLPSGGLFVSEVRQGSRAAGAGIRPGDLLVSTGDEPLKGAEDLLALGETISLVREGRKLVVATDPAFALDSNPAHPRLTALDQKSRLHAAGLRTGDAIVRIGSADDPSVAELTRLLARAQPAFVIYQRDDRYVGAIVP